MHLDSTERSRRGESERGCCLSGLLEVASGKWQVRKESEIPAFDPVVEPAAAPCYSRTGRPCSGGWRSSCRVLPGPEGWLSFRIPKNWITSGMFTGVWRACWRRRPSRCRLGRRAPRRRPDTDSLARMGPGPGPLTGRTASPKRRPRHPRRRTSSSWARQRTMKPCCGRSSSLTWRSVVSSGQGPRRLPAGMRAPPVRPVPRPRRRSQAG